MKKEEPKKTLNAAEAVSGKEVRKYLKPLVFHPDSMKTFRQSLLFLFCGKALSLIAPFILKRIVDSMILQAGPSMIKAAGTVV